MRQLLLAARMLSQSRLASDSITLAQSSWTRTVKAWSDACHGVRFLLARYCPSVCDTTLASPHLLLLGMLITLALGETKDHVSCCLPQISCAYSMEIMRISTFSIQLYPRVLTLRLSLRSVLRMRRADPGGSQNYLQIPLPAYAHN